MFSRHRLARFAVRSAHRSVNALALTLAAVVLLLGGYGIWENHALLSDGQSLKWQEYTPFVEGDGQGFAELAKANPDVRGWLTLDDTSIDYPLLYSDSVGKYLNRDAWGNHSLAGSLFFDTLTPPDLRALPTIIYGHHMEGESMFGPLTQYRSEEYFQAHRTGTLLADGHTYDLDVVGVIETDAYDSSVYRRRAGVSEEEYRARLEERMSLRSEEGFDPNQRVVLLSTCTTLITNGRLVLVTQAHDTTLPVPEKKALARTGTPLGLALAAAGLAGLAGLSGLWLSRSGGGLGVFRRGGCLVRSVHGQFRCGSGSVRGREFARGQSARGSAAARGACAQTRTGCVSEEVGGADE